MSESTTEASTPLLVEFADLRTALANNDYDRAIEPLQQAFNSLMDQERFADVLTLHEAILQSLADNHEATELRLWCLLGVGNACFHLGRDADAETAYAKMRDEARDADDLYLCSIALARLGDLARRRGKTDSAEQLYQESIEIRMGLGDVFGVIETLLFLAMSREQSGQWEQADAALKAAEGTLRSVRASVFNAHAPEYEQSYHYWEMALWFERANLRRAKGDLLGAARIYLKALRAAQERRDAVAEAKLLQNLASNKMEQEQVAQAVPLYERSLSIAHTNGFTSIVSEAQVGLAIAFFLLKRYEESASLYEAACDAAKQNGDNDRWASLATDAGAACVEAGQMQKAMRLLDEALVYFRVSGNCDGQERTLRNLLIVDARKPDKESLETHLHECLNLLHRSANAQRSYLYRLAGNLCLQVMDDPAAATRYFGQAVEEVAVSGDTRQAGQTAALAAAGLAEAGALTDALRLFDRSTELFAQVEDMPDLWRTRNDRGNVFARLGLSDEAVEEYVWCLQIARERQDRVLEAQALLNYGEAKRRIGEIHEAISSIERSLTLYCAMEDREGELDARNGLGLCLLDTRRYGELERTGEASVHFEQALELAKLRKDRPGEAMATRGLAHVAERRGDIPTALRLFLRAADLWERAGDFTHSAEALASRVTLQVLQFDPRRWQKDTDRLVQMAVKAGRIGTASRGIMGAAGHLMQAGSWEAAAGVASFAISLQLSHDFGNGPAQDQENQVMHSDVVDDLGAMLLYLIDGMESWMSPQERSLFLDHVTNPDNFENPADGTDLRESLEAIRKGLAAQGRYNQG